MPPTGRAVTGGEIPQQERRTPSEELMRTLARNVRQRRKELGWSQEELAGRCEMKRTFLSLIEGGKSNVTLATLEILAGALKCSEAVLLARRRKAKE